MELADLGGTIWEDVKSPGYVGEEFSKAYEKKVKSAQRPTQEGSSALVQNQLEYSEQEPEVEIRQFPDPRRAERARVSQALIAAADSEGRLPLDALPNPVSRHLIDQLDQQGIPVSEFVQEFYQLLYDPSEIFTPEEWKQFVSFSRWEAVFNRLVVRILQPLWWTALQFAAFAVEKESPGPALFEQQRIGRFGQFFTIKKLRTMYVGVEGTTFTQKNDQRVTPLGRWFRKTKVDEFFQFYNILDGEMNIIGRRPIVPAEAFLAFRKDPRYGWTWLELPALAGQGQVRSEHCSTPEQNLCKAELDLHYMKRKSFARVFRLIFETVWAIATGKGGR